MRPQRPRIGRARTVLVFGQGAAGRAVVATVVAMARRRSGRQCLSFHGPARFSAAAVQHLREVVLPLVSSTVEQLGLPPQAFEVSLVNLGAASASGIALDVSGFSADAAVALAMLSATTKIAVPSDVAITGHIASADGDIRAVRGLPAKVEAALRTPGILTFVCPALDADGSLDVLMPQEKERVEVALARARGRVRLAEVSDFAQLLQVAVPDEAIVLGALRSGFFDGPQVGDLSDSGAGELATFLAQGNEERFWRVLEAHLLAGDAIGAQELLASRARFQIRRKSYPKGFGCRLLQLVRSLPPATRRIRTAFPLLPEHLCLLLSRQAREPDYEDLPLLLDAVAGRVAWPAEGGDGNAPLRVFRRRDAEAAVDAVLGEISTEALATKIGLPIDSARAAYALQAVTTPNYDEFMATIASFYLFLLRHTANAADTVRARDVAPDAQALVERAFRDQGGFAGARAEAKSAVHGGLRLVLDSMSDQHKHEQEMSHVHGVLKQALDPLGWDDRVRFMGALVKRVGHELPPELRRLPPDQLVRHYEPIVQAYVRSLDRLKQLLRAL